jgi:hypothetical protein
VIGYIGDKLNLITTRSRGQSITSQASFTISPNVNDEGTMDRRPSLVEDCMTDDLEILCGGVVLTAQMTLAILKVHYWKSSSDIVLNYRKRVVV